MPAKPSWLLEVPRMQEILKGLDTPVVDRQCFEHLFKIRRRRAIQLMHQFGGYQAGRTFLIERSKLIRCLRQLTGDYEWELARRTKLVSELERTKKLLPGRKVRLMVSPETSSYHMADLPAGVQLSAGELRVEFHGTEDLLRQLFELSQAIMNDYKKFEGICEGQSPNKHSDV